MLNFGLFVCSAIMLISIFISILFGAIILFWLINLILFLVRLKYLLFFIVVALITDLTYHFSIMILIVPFSIFVFYLIVISTLLLRHLFIDYNLALKYRDS